MWFSVDRPICPGKRNLFRMNPHLREQQESSKSCRNNTSCRSDKRLFSQGHKRSGLLHCIQLQPRLPPQSSLPPVQCEHSDVLLHAVRKFDGCRKGQRTLPLCSYCTRSAATCWARVCKH